MRFSWGIISRSFAFCRFGMSLFNKYFCAFGAALVLPFSAQANVFSDFFDSLFGSGGIGTVQEAVLPEYSSTITLGDALDNYSDCKKDSSSWSSFEQKGRDIVEFQCRLQKSPQLISSNKANPFMLGLLGASSFFTGKEGPKLSREAMQSYFKFESITMHINFALSKVDDQDFEVQDIIFSVNFSDGQRGQVNLDPKALKRVFADKPMADFESAEEFGSFVEDLVAAHDADLKDDAGEVI